MPSDVALRLNHGFDFLMSQSFFLFLGFAVIYMIRALSSQTEHAPTLRNNRLFTFALWALLIGAATGLFVYGYNQPVTEQMQINRSWN